jgi:hypothetical protein
MNPITERNQQNAKKSSGPTAAATANATQPAAENTQNQTTAPAPEDEKAAA